jgi:hypothetical protein
VGQWGLSGSDRGVGVIWWRLESALAVSTFIGPRLVSQLTPLTSECLNGYLGRSQFAKGLQRIVFTQRSALGNAA